MKLPLVLACLLTLSLPGLLTLRGAEAGPTRPRITGISHAAFYVSDMAKARAFYEGYLGFASPYSIPRPDSSEHLVFIKINDRQTIELFPKSGMTDDTDRLYHIAIETDDAEGMRLYLQSKGIAVPPKTPVGKIGNRNYFVKDPNGNIVEIVEYTPESWTRREAGKFMPDTRIAPRMNHVGVMVGELAASLKFYGETLGFQETWRGSVNGITLNWINLRVPEGQDYVEFMLYDKYPTTSRLRSMHHVSLELPDIPQALAILKSRACPEGARPATEFRIGTNGKRLINTYDPDGTRVEMMEPGTADGNPRPSSTATPPVAAPKPN